MDRIINLNKDAIINRDITLDLRQKMTGEKAKIFDANITKAVYYASIFPQQSARIATNAF